MSVRKEAAAYSETWYIEDHRKKGNELFALSDDILTNCVKCYLTYLEVLPETFHKFYKEEINKIVEDNDDKKVIPFLIELAWQSKHVDLIKGEIHQLANFLLRSRPTPFTHDAYLEQILDLLNYKTEDLIPVSILKGVCLAEPEEKYQYGAFIKAVSYLKRHDKDIVENVVNELTQTDRYRKDEYYREWVD